MNGRVAYLGMFLFLSTHSAVAATVRGWIAAPRGSYKIELFRVGDPFPSRQYRNVQINTGGGYATFYNISSGHYFVRATLESDYRLVGQGPSGHVTGYFPWTQAVPTCFVNP